jgi:hypothetical protein
LVDAISSMADAAGSAPVEFIPMLCACVEKCTPMYNKIISNVFFMAWVI